MTSPNTLSTSYCLSGKKIKEEGERRKRAEGRRETEKEGVNLYDSDEGAQIHPSLSSFVSGNWGGQKPSGPCRETA